MSWQKLSSEAEGALDMISRAFSDHIIDRMLKELEREQMKPRTVIKRRPLVGPGTVLNHHEHPAATTSGDNMS